MGQSRESCILEFDSHLISHDFTYVDYVDAFQDLSSVFHSSWPRRLMDSVILAVQATCRLREVFAAHAPQAPLLCQTVASVRVAPRVPSQRKEVLQHASLVLQEGMRGWVSFVPTAFLAPSRLLVAAPAPHAKRASL